MRNAECEDRAHVNSAGKRARAASEDTNLTDESRSHNEPEPDNKSAERERDERQHDVFIYISYFLIRFNTYNLYGLYIQ